MRTWLLIVGSLLAATPVLAQSSISGTVLPSGDRAEGDLAEGEYVLEGRRPDGTRYRGVATLAREGDELVMNVRMAGGGGTRTIRAPFDAGATEWTFSFDEVQRGTPGAAGVLDHLGSTPPPAADRRSRRTITLRRSANGKFFEGQLMDGGAPGARERLISPAELTAELQGRYGARPRTYAGTFNQDNEAERVMVATLRDATAQLNQKLAARGLKARVDMAMLATNFLTEGGILPINANQLQGISGFGHLGIDTIVDNYANVKHWLPASVRPAVEDPKNQYRTRNELGQTVTTVDALTLEQGIHANAAMFVMNTAILERDLAARGVDISTLDPRVQFFWNTMYFNAGPGFGRRMLDQHGVDYARRKYTGRENSQNAKFNATWRTGSYELLSRRVVLEGEDAAFTRFLGGP